MPNPKTKAIQQAEVTPPPTQGNPAAVPLGVQDHSFHAQAIYDINKQVGKLETGLENVEKRLEKAETKLEAIHLDVHGAKKIAWAFGAILSVMGTLGLLLLNKILDLVVSHFAK